MSGCSDIWGELPFWSRLQAKALEKGKPYHSMLMLTDACNLDCYFCAFTKQSNKKKQLGYNEWIKIIDELYDLGIFHVCLTGGEVTILPWFEDIYKYLLQKGFIVAVKTNANQITEHLKDVFREFPPYAVLITVYGASSDTYKRITGDADAYERVLDAIDYFRTIKTRLEVGMTITQDNLGDVPSVVELLWSKGLKTGLNTDIFPRLDGLDNGYGRYRLTPGQRVSLLTSDVECYQDILQEARDLDVHLSDWVPHDKIPFMGDECRIGVCIEAKTGLAIMNDGKVQYCTNYAIEQDIDVRDGVKNAWEALCRHYDENFRLSEYCHQCEDRSFCHANCPARFHLASGEATVPDAYICQFAALYRLKKQSILGGKQNENVHCS